MHCWTFLNKITQPGGLLQWQSHDFNHIWASSFLRIHCKFHVTLPKKKKKKNPTSLIHTAIRFCLSLFLEELAFFFIKKQELLGAKPLHFIASTVAISSLFLLCDRDRSIPVPSEALLLHLWHESQLFPCLLQRPSSTNTCFSQAFHSTPFSYKPDYWFHLLGSSFWKDVR